MFPRHIMLTNCCLSTTEKEVFVFVRLFEAEKTKSKSLKHYLGLVVGVSALVILLLGACTFGAVFVAVKATKDTQVSTSGALMNKEGSHMLSTVAQGTRFQLYNTSEDTPLCVSTINQFTCCHSYHHSPFLTSIMSFYQHCNMQIAGETFGIIQSDVPSRLQGYP